MSYVLPSPTTVDFSGTSTPGYSPQTYLVDFPEVLSYSVFRTNAELRASVFATIGTDPIMAADAVAGITSAANLYPNFVPPTSVDFAGRDTGYDVTESMVDFPDAPGATAFSAAATLALTATARLSVDTPFATAATFEMRVVANLRPYFIYGDEFDFDQTTGYDKPEGWGDVDFPVRQAPPEQVTAPYGLVYTEFETGHTVINDDRFLDMEGWAATEYGTGLVADEIRTLIFTGEDSLEFGAATVDFFGPPKIVFVGEEFTRFGSAMQVYNYNLIVDVPGNDFTLFGDTEADNVQPQYVIPNGVEMTTFGDGAVTFFPQYLTPEGIEFTAFGDFSVITSPRYLRPDWLVSTVWGIAGVVRWLEAAPRGFDRLSFGTPLVERSPQLEPQGLIATEFPELFSVRSTFSFARFDGFDSLVFGNLGPVYNLNLDFPLDDGLLPETEYGGFTVENVWQELRFYGLHSFEHAGWRSTVRLTGRNIGELTSNDFFESDHFHIANEPQLPAFGGYEATRFPPRFDVFNNTDFIAPETFSPTEYGRPAIGFQRDVVPQGAVMSAFGGIYRVWRSPRYLEQYNLACCMPLTVYGTAKASISPQRPTPFPTVQTQYGRGRIDYDPPHPVEPLGEEFTEHGAMTVFNANRDVEVLGTDQLLLEAVQRPLVSHLRRFVNPPGLDATQIPRYDIRDMAQYVIFDGTQSLDSLEFSLGVQVRNAYTPPFGEDRDLDLLSGEEPFTEFGLPFIRNSSLTLDGSTFTEFGSFGITDNLVEFRQYYPWTEWGTFAAGDQFRILQMEWDLLEDTPPEWRRGAFTEFGGTDVNPKYIHPVGFLYAYDPDDPQNEYQWGLFKAQNFNRTVLMDPYPLENILTLYGSHGVSRDPEYLDFTGKAQTRYGAGSLIPHPQEVFAKGFEASEFGLPVLLTDFVPRDGTVDFTDRGRDMTEFSPEQWFTNVDRNVWMVGTDQMTVYGNNEPMVYHKPRGPADTGDHTATEFGVAWVSHSPRTLSFEGETQTLYPWTIFVDKDTIDKTATKLLMEGFTATEFGSMQGEATRQFIGPYGFSWGAVSCGATVDHADV